LYIQSTNEEHGFALCNLSKKGVLQFPLQHEFGPEDSPVLFWTTGDHIHLTGNWIWDDDELSEGEEGDDCCDHDHDHKEEVEEEVTPAPTQTEAKKTKNKRSSEETEEPVTTTSSSSKKQKKSKDKSAAEAITPSAELVVISKPPSDQITRPVWNIKPFKAEGTLIPSPKQKSQSGVLVTDYVIGHGTEPKLGSTVCITYEGLFPNGKRFDSNLKRSKPLKFRKGSGQVLFPLSNMIQ
jgi:FKBP-type peptidyl-prolyl cis-trans isomerase